MLRDVLKNLSDDIGKISELTLAAILLPAVAKTAAVLIDAGPGLSAGITLLAAVALGARASSTFLEMWEHYTELWARYAATDGDGEQPAL